jgi:enamine deaminase RidA (YjgF/YER057c/UK114 family)
MMIIRQNRYTVQAEDAVQNQECISRVVEDLGALRRNDIRYSVYVEDDGKTFLHLLFCANEEAEQVFFNLPSQQAFQDGLAASRFEVPPTMATLHLVGWTSDSL